MVNGDNVIATIRHVYGKQGWRSGDMVMHMQPLEIVSEKNNEIIALDASDITHIFWNQLADKRFENSSPNNKHDNLTRNPNSTLSSCQDSSGYHSRCPSQPKSSISNKPNEVGSPQNEQAGPSNSQNYNPNTSFIEKNYVSGLTSDDTDSENDEG